MKRIEIALIICLTFGFMTSYCQVDSLKTSIKKTSFYCYNKKLSIEIPNDFIGPKYYSYEEGSIISFTSRNCIITVLCGGDARIETDSTYQKTDSLFVQKKFESYKYYSSRKNLYARKDILKNMELLYENIPENRKVELDRILDNFEKELCLEIETKE